VDVQDLMLTVIRRIEVILIISNIYVVNLSSLDIKSNCNIHLHSEQVLQSMSGREETTLAKFITGSESSLLAETVPISKDMHGQLVEKICLDGLTFL